MTARIFEALRNDHDKQRTLLELVGKTHGDSQGRRELFARLKAELSAHAKAEEQSLYASMLAEDHGQEKARHSVAEHHEIDELLETLDDMDFSNPRWLATFERLRDQVIHHLDEEEHQVFQVAGRVLPEAKKEELASVYEDAHPKH